MPDASLRISGGRDSGGRAVDIGVESGLFAPVADDAATLSAAGLVVVPGFIDLQLNGAFGDDFTDDPASIWRVAARLPELGTTAFLPTLVSPAIEQVDAARNVLAAPPPGFAGSVPLGLHIEGPMISAARRGTHPAARLVEQTAAYDWSRETGVALVTLAPELPGSTDAIRRLVDRGVVVSLGHSDATASVASSAADAGARFGTHLFNAMSSMTSREPGLAGFLLTDERMRFGLIADGLHLDHRTVQLAHAAAGDRIVLVTDAMAATGVGDGVYSLADVTVRVTGLEARNEAGGLAGSVLTLPQAVRTFQSDTGCSLTEAVAAATHRPAAVIGADDRGSLAIGKRADLVLLDDRFDVAATIADGRLVYLRDPERLEDR